LFVMMYLLSVWASTWPTYGILQAIPKAEMHAQQGNSVIIRASGNTSEYAVGYVEYVHIRADGSIDPPSAGINTLDNVTYVFTRDINGSIEIERNGVVIDGKNHTLTAPWLTVGSSYGFSLTAVKNVTIKNTNINGFVGIDWFLGSSGVLLNSSSSNCILSNNITGNRHGIELLNSTSNSIAGNNIANNDVGIALSASNNNSIVENDIMWRILIFPCAGRGIDLYESCNCTISRNTFVNNGLYVWNSYWNVVMDNMVNGKPLVYLENSSDMAVENAGQVILINYYGMRVQGLDLSNSSVGVELLRTNETQVSGNRIAGNVYGIVLWSSTHCSIIGNSITTSAVDGIALLDSSECSIVGNNLTWNMLFGIDAAGSFNNSIYHNNFIESEAETDQYYNNSWDDGYPSGGNYWNDYTGTDEKSGSNQSEPGSDGLGDTPYRIDESNVDSYPLMSLWISPSISADINGDGKVNILDIALIARVYGSSTGQPRYRLECDLNCDGSINIIDIAIAAKAFGKASS
jgi:parallel beta-helix repeat protein